MPRSGLRPCVGNALGLRNGNGYGSGYGSARGMIGPELGISRQRRLLRLLVIMRGLSFWFMASVIANAWGRASVRLDGHPGYRANWPSFRDRIAATGASILAHLADQISARNDPTITAPYLRLSSKCGTPLILDDRSAFPGRSGGNRCPPAIDPDDLYPKGARSS